MRKKTPTNPLRLFLINEVREGNEKVKDKTDLELDQLIFCNSKSLRVTRDGYLLLSSVFETHRFMLKCEEGENPRLTGKELIALKRYVPWPYYLTNRYLHLFDSKNPFYLNLNGGDIKAWLLQLYNQNQ